MRLLLSWTFLFSSLGSVISQANESPPQLTKNLRASYIINVSLRSSFSCSFSGNPTPSITWTYNGERVPDTPQGSGAYADRSTGTLMLTEAGPEHSGTYKCIAENVRGSDSASTEIKIIRNNMVVHWYSDWYMIIIYTLVVWALLIPLFIGWFYYTKKRASKNLPPADPWIGN